jgi:hypothetical protein
MLPKKAWTWGVLLAVFLLVDALLLLSVLTAPRSITPALLPTAEYLEQNPAPTPEFITQVFNGANRVCAEVSQRFFAKVGISIEELHQHIEKNEQFRLDGTQVQPVSASVWLTANLEDGKVYGGEIYFCVDTGNLSPGLHLASITVPDLDGIEHTHSWAFRYDPNSPTSDPNILPTLMPLPTLTPTN